MKFQMFSTLVALVWLVSNAAALAIPQDYDIGYDGDDGYGDNGGGDYDDSYIEVPPTWHKRGGDLPNAWNTSFERTYNTFLSKSLLLEIFVFDINTYRYY